MSKRTRFVAVALLAAATLLGLAGLASATHPTGSSAPLVVLGNENFDDDGDGFADPGRGSVSDVWAFGNYAYVGSFDEPLCTLDETGIRIVDISNPANPHQVGFLPSPPNTRVNDPKVTHIETPFFEGEILIGSNEVCGNGFIPRQQSKGLSFGGGQGGINIWDVTNPLKPRNLKSRFLPFQVHNTFTWQQGQNAYTLVVDDENLRDVHIVDVTKPQSPKEIAVTGAPDWPDANDNIGVGEIFLHDGWVQQDPTDGHFYAYLSYWDLGLVVLDVTDPKNPMFVSDSDYPDPDPASGEKPDGNSHVTVPNAGGNLVLMGDEDFSPNELEELQFTFEGTTFDGLEGDFTEPIFRQPASMLTGPVVWTGGVGCTPDSIPAAPTPDSIALVQRGVCFFQDKAESANAQGYAGFIVANTAAGGDALLNMAGVEFPYPAIPGFFVGHDTGEAMKTAGVGITGGTVVADGVFNGWGYLRVIDVGDKANPAQVGDFWTENVLNPARTPFDEEDVNLTMHNVVNDSDHTAYISWYWEGMRVVDFSDPTNPTEVAHFVDTVQGSDFWGVYLHTLPNGTQLVLGSDRSTGLWVFADPVATP